MKSSGWNEDFVGDFVSALGGMVLHGDVGCGVMLLIMVVGFHGRRRDDFF